ncbi:MAG: rod shape-determining protein RodA [Pseudomonadota bacterium]|jgi:rod shape determining protein RodA
MPIMASVFNSSPLWHRIKPWFRGFDIPLVTALAMLVGVSLLAMYSSAYSSSTRFGDHIRNLCIAATILFLMAQLPPHRLMTMAIPLYSIGVTLLLAVALFGITKKGSTRWINIGITVIQPSEILKIAMPLMLAWWFQKHEGQLRPRDFGVGILLLGIPVALVMKQPDLGTALLILIAGVSVIFYAGLKWRWVVPPVVLGIVVMAALVIYEAELCDDGVRWFILHDYQQQRICTLLNPTRDPLGKGFHIIQGMIAIGAGGLTGMGFLSGTQTHLEFVPEHTTDFIFAAWSEEMGLLGNLFLIGTYLFLVLRGLFIALDAPTLFTRLLAGSMSMIFFAYAFVNMGMVSGILPVVGVPLPLVSYGGTAMVTMGLAAGILMSIAKAKHLVQT